LRCLVPLAVIEQDFLRAGRQRSAILVNIPRLSFLTPNPCEKMTICFGIPSS
jgi:hypothetical protein